MEDFYLHVVGGGDLDAALARLRHKGITANKHEFHTRRDDGPEQTHQRLDVTVSAENAESARLRIRQILPDFTLTPATKVA